MMGKAVICSCVWSLVLVGLISCSEVDSGGQGAGNVGVDASFDSVESETIDTISEIDGVEEDTQLISDDSWNYAPCTLDTRVGGFVVTLAEEYTGINGQVLGGVVPVNIPELIAEEGDCKLLKSRNLFCDPGCVPGETCGEEGTCIPYPEALSVGSVTVTGLKTTETMEAKWGNHYTNTGSLEHPAFETSASLHLSATGGEIEAFGLYGVGVSPLIISLESKQVSASNGTGITLQWEAGPTEEGIRVQIELNINNHGSTNAWIACEVEDTGGFEISAELLSALYDFGVSGFPSLSLTRRSADSVELSIGCVEFFVESEAAVAIEFEGVTSCTSDNQCPPGQSCGVDLQCHP